MTLQVRTALIAAAIALGGILLYARGLDRVPPYLIHDEVQGALHAEAIATTARGLDGQLLPLYFAEPGFPAGRDPLMIYWTALWLKVLPFSEVGVRTPTALIAVVNLVLMFFAARAVFQSTWAGVVAALLLAITPVNFIRSRLLLSPVYSIPFVLGWLWWLAQFEKSPTSRRFVIACVWLGLGMYSYLAAVVMMPLYLLMTIAVAARSLRWRTVVLSAVTMSLCVAPMAAWYLTHSDRNSQIVSAYQLSNTAQVAGRSIRLYWSFFDPSYLFVSGDPSLINSTRQSGLFPFAFAVLIPVGVVALLRMKDPIGRVIVAGVFTAPIVSVISGAIEMNRVPFAIPFTVLVAAAALVDLWNRRRPMPMALAGLLMAAMALQFVSFHRYYMSDTHRVGSAGWYSGNVREALRELIARSGDGPIYISTDIGWVEGAWRFYAIEAGRQDLMARTTFMKEVPATVDPNARMLCPEDTAACQALSTSGLWQRVVVVPSLDGQRFVILQRRLPASNHGD